MISFSAHNTYPLLRIVARLISRIPPTLKKLKVMLGPMLEERLQKDSELGRDWEGKPVSVHHWECASNYSRVSRIQNDLVSWLLEAAPPPQRTVDDLVIRIMMSEFGGLHTTSIVVSDTLFDLAARPEYIQPLREEIEQIIGQHGWTKDAFNRMHKLDSFIKESSRLGGLNSGQCRRHSLDICVLRDASSFACSKSSERFHVFQWAYHSCWLHRRMR